MPAVAGLSPVDDALRFGWFGKHPGLGDFVSRGVAEPLQAAMQDWLDGALGAWRAEAGEAWADAFDAARPVRFWLGGGVLGEGRSGVMAPSRDRVGRRYPLIAWGAGAIAPPPLDADQSAFDALEAALDAVRADPDAPVPGDAAPPPVEDLLWAMNGSGDVAGLLSDIAAEDMARATQSRSYWWTAGGDAARVVSATGLPDGRALAWVMTGRGDAG
ncbi:type VI secretion system-associated protein TagF [Jannaschia sp. Os4]|uniref:type VI secretion system-associated protein TagF n=1 Tax=Jannaschia sp. Os4 TaxID=2807617 RepID=UPI0019396254|nr:type VI secretion system-associated protein TagF [Jannaschia sp. Os4]MBM2578074.1 type VI secretion system-associated protein TagF [Jannaschia sp. Os4]